MRDLRIGAAMILAMSAGTAFGADWAAGTSGLWNNATLWTPMNVPDVAGETATLGAGGAYTVTVNISPTIDFLSLASDATLNVEGARTVTLLGSIANDGDIRLNSNATASNGLLVFSADAMLSGAGTITLVRSGDDSQLNTTFGFTLTQDVNHAIIGLGQLNAALVNNGLVSADGGTMLIRGADKVNNSLFEALSGAVLGVEGITVIQDAAGMIVARDGGIVRYSSSSSIVGGTLVTEGAGFQERILGTSTFENVTSNGRFDVQGAGTILVSGAGLTNNGVFNLNSTASASDGVLTFISTGTLGGAGVVEMLRPGNDSRIESSDMVTITHGAAHRIEGQGQINAMLVNNGTISADLPASTLTLQTNPKTNNSIMEATNGGILAITGITVTQAESAEIRADGGAISLTSGSNIVDGILRTLNGGVITRGIGTSTLSSVVLNGDLDIQGGGTVNFDSGLRNNGLIRVNSTASASDAVLRFAATTILNGSGEVQMLRGSTDSTLATAPGAVGTVGANQWIHGLGAISADLVNDGLIEADVASNVLALTTNPKHNNGTLAATNDGILDVASIDLTQSATGMLIADGGRVSLTGGNSITGGMLASTNGGVVRREVATTTVEDLAFSGDLEVVGGGVIRMVNTDFINDGHIVVNSNSSSLDAVLAFASDVTLDGVGTVLLNRGESDSSLITETGVTGHIGAGQIIEGSGLTNGTFINDGLFRATSIIPMNIAGTMTNNALLTAVTGGIMDLESNTVDQTGGGEILADGGIINLRGGGQITGGDLRTTNGGIIRRAIATTLLDDVTLDGDVQIEGGGVFQITSAGLINHGDLLVNYNSSSLDAVVEALADMSIGGAGRILLPRGFTDSLINANGFVITHEAGHTIEGAGTISGGFINQGDIIANSGAAMTLNATAEGFVNEALIHVNGAGGMTISNGANFDNQGDVLVSSGILTAIIYNQSAGTTEVNTQLTSTTGANITGGVLKGAGTVSGVLNINGGAVAPGNSAGTLKVTGTYNQSATGTYQVEHNGTGMGEADRITVTGSANLDGAVEVQLGYAPATGDSVTILSTTAAMNGEFATLTTPDISPNTFYLVYGTNTVNLVATCRGDIDGSGTVNFDDLNLLLEEWATDGTRGDVDGNGTVNFDDLNVLLEEWANTCS